MARYSIAVTLLVLALTRTSQAELIRPTDLTYCSDRAALVVVGKLDAENKRTVSRVLNTARMDLTMVKIEPTIGQSIRNAMGVDARKPIDVIAFLDQRNQPVLGTAGVVGLSGNGVYFLQQGPFDRGSTHSLHATYTRKLFLAATEQAITNSKLRREIEKLPRSSERARKAIAFLFDHKPLALTAWRQDYHLSELAKALAPAHKDEEATILAALDGAAAPEKRVMLLKLIGGVPLGQNAFERVAKWIGREHDASTRQAAVSALTRIDHYRATERIVPMLSLDDPQLQWLLIALSQRPDASDQVRNSHVVGALLKLTTELRKRHQLDGPHTLQNESYHLLATLQDYFHPQMFQPLIDWALANDHTSSNQALANLQTLTGIEFTRENTEPLKSWWNKAKPILTAKYDLNSEAGLESFLDRYRRAVQPTQRMLNRLWRFEPKIIEQELLSKVTTPDLAKAAAPKAVLSNLWQEKRLSPATKKQIVNCFLRLELIELPRTDDRHELRIVAHRDFPFPRDAWVQPNTAWEIAPRKPKLRDSWGSLSLHGEGPTTLGSFGTGSRRGKPTATAILALREVDHSKSGKVAWQLQWELGPLQLREERKKQ